MHGNAYQWTQAIEDEILLRIANGESLKAICEDDWLPSRETVRVRIINDADFAGRYARAREAQADTFFDDCLEIADNARNDWMERKGKDDTGWIENGEHLQRSRLRIDARKWMAGKLRPKVYGDKADLNVTGGLSVTLADSVRKL
jgi:hypothetical protein